VRSSWLLMSTMPSPLIWRLVAVLVRRLVAERMVRLRRRDDDGGLGDGGDRGEGGAGESADGEVAGAVRARRVASPAAS